MRFRLSLLVIGLAWLGLARVLAQHAAPLLPRSLAAALTLHSFLSLVLLVASAAGLAATRLLVPRARSALGVDRATPFGVVTGLLLGPIVLAASAYVAFEIALPTLIDELLRGGKQAVEANTGELGRSVAESHWAMTLAWGVLLTPIAEELIFRGALWEGLRRLMTARDASVASERSSDEPRSLPRELMNDSWLVRAFRALRGRLAGVLATIITAGLFAWLHADAEGGAGIVRIVQTLCLGLALGGARQVTGGLWAPIALHATFNALTVAKLRHWLTGPGWPVKQVTITDTVTAPVPLPIPLVWWHIALACALVLALLSLLRWRRLCMTRAVASRHVPFPPERVFALITEPQTIPRTFHGHGPVPGAEHAELEGDMRVGARRRVHNSDGSVVDEEIVALEPPHLQAYALRGGLAWSFRLLVREAGGRWELEQAGDGTDITWTFTFRLTSALLQPVALPLVGAFRQAMRDALERTETLLASADEA